VILLDGPMGSELGRRGVDTSTPLWSAEGLVAAPDVVRAVHASYAAAGATHHRTNTFRARRRTAGADWERLARLAVRLAREGAAGGVVLGSVGPLEDCYRPDLAPEDDVARREHAELVRVLVDAGVDALICETFASPREAAIAAGACARTGKETWVSLTAGPSADLMTPAAMREAARACAGEGAAAVLVNCVAARLTLPYVDALVAVHDRVGVYANASAWNEPPISAAEYAEHARTWLAHGATIVGACCGNSEAVVRALAALRA
jgi:S-methylmethionine-dependent homocysteine/selenocysteine methylase